MSRKRGGLALRRYARRWWRLHRDAILQEAARRARKA